MLDVVSARISIEFQVLLPGILSCLLRCVARDFVQNGETEEKKEIKSTGRRRNKNKRERERETAREDDNLEVAGFQLSGCTRRPSTSSAVPNVVVVVDVDVAEQAR